MQDLKIYIVIEDPLTKESASIRGNFDVFRAFLSGVGNLEDFSAAPRASPLNVTVTQQQETKKTIRPRAITRRSKLNS